MDFNELKKYLEKTLGVGKTRKGDEWVAEVAYAEYLAAKKKQHSSARIAKQEDKEALRGLLSTREKR